MQARDLVYALLYVNVMCSDISLRYPHLSPRNKESFDVGCNLFAKFSAYIKNTQKEANKSKTPYLNLLFFSHAHNHILTQLK